MNTRIWMSRTNLTEPGVTLYAYDAWVDRRGQGETVRTQGLADVKNMTPTL